MLSFKGFLKGLVVALVLVSLLAAGARFFGLFGHGDVSETPAELAKQAMAALDAVKKRQPGDRRPASYDAIMTPLDKLLAQAKTLLQDEAYNPDVDFNTIRALATPVIDIAPLAERQARTETGPLAKEYRFGDQKGEACQYLASAMLQKINSARSRASRTLEDAPPPPAAEMNELRRILDAGIDSAPDNRDLWYLRGVLNRMEGLFAAAAKDLERAVAIDPAYAEGWSALGLVRISLKDFDAAEQALEKSKELSLAEAKNNGVEPGEGYTSIIYNLGMFHEGLAAYYGRENRIDPTVENRRLLTRHAAEAEKYLREFLAREPADSPDARTARARLDTLPK